MALRTEMLAPGAAPPWSPRDVPRQTLFSLHACLLFSRVGLTVLAFLLPLLKG